MTSLWRLEGPERQRREAERGSHAAKAERKASRSKYKDKSKHEALAIARAKFERLLESPAWTGVDLEPGRSRLRRRRSGVVTRRQADRVQS